MKQQRVWDKVFESKQDSVMFTSDDVTCPVCESYRVDESSTGSKCLSCGQFWVKNVVRK